jgi:predicted histidine transporter YuiF (NhaC family)
MIAVSDEMRMYLMFIADSNLFGGIAILSFMLIVTAISKRLRQSWLHRALTFMVLVSLVTIELAGGYYSSVPPA